MGIVTRFVGLDYHQSKVQVCVMDAEGHVLKNRDCRNNCHAIQRMIDAEGAQVTVAVEACCGAADLADELAAATGWDVRLAHAGYVNRIKQNPDKTDYGDARLLADPRRLLL